MATKTLVALSEYLETSFDGTEPDYVDGELVARSMPNSNHSGVQAGLIDAFKPYADRHGMFRAPEIRLRVSDNRFRIVDFAVFATRPAEEIPESAPVAVFEIVSPDDRFEDLMSKFLDYERAGIEHIFVADPPLRKVSRFRNGDLLTAAVIEIPEYGVQIPAQSIFL